MKVEKLKEKDTDHLRFVLSNDKGMSVHLTNYGATIMAVYVLDRNGNMENVVLGFDTIKEYEKDNSFYFGSIIGRYANRIAHGKLRIGATEYQLSQNESTTHLHGGFKGFDKKTWELIELKATEANATLTLFYLSKDNEEGYSGNLSTTVKFRLNNKNELSWEYHCKTDKTTIVNLTHHDYFNLKDGGQSSILDHRLTIYAEKYTPMNEQNLPTGKIESLENHYADFRKSARIGSKQKSGNFIFDFNHNFVLHKTREGLQKAAELYEAESGRLMEVWTTQPGIQLYTAAHLKKNTIGAAGKMYGPFHGLCLETQHFPDSPNHAHFPSTLLLAGADYKHRNCLRFYIK